MSDSFHKSNLGAFGEHLSCDMDGYVHTTAAGWLAAPVDMPSADRDDAEYMQQWAEEQAQETRDAVAAAEEKSTAWQAGN